MCPFVGMCITCVPGAFGGQKRVLGLLGLEFQMVVSYHVGARNRSWVLGNSLQYF